MPKLFSDEPHFNGVGHGVFLAGPTPRSSHVPSWRPQAIKLLEEGGYKGTILIPERKDWSAQFDYIDQIEWEQAGLFNCDRIIFWVPRDLQDMPAFTTNVEFGFWMSEKPEKCVYGRPPAAPKNSYLDWLYQEHTGKEPLDSLEEVVAVVLEDYNVNQFGSG